MASIQKSILQSALEDGLIPKRLTPNQVEYLHPTVITANRLYWAIADADDEIDYEQLAHRTGLAINTVRQFCGWMTKTKLIKSESVTDYSKNQTVTKTMIRIYK